FKSYNLVSARLHIGQYNGNPEPTAVIEISRLHGVTDGEVKEWCKYFTQECIAIERTILSAQRKVYTEGVLVYNPDYTGDRYTFDAQYFIK
ncbi:MAG: hypothetical protein ACK5DE_14060, partial [Bacteroidota bacterium]